MLILLLIIGGALFVGYAVYTQYGATLPGESVPKRVWASIVAAGMAIGAAAMSWLHGVTGP